MYTSRAAFFFPRVEQFFECCCVVAKLPALLLQLGEAPSRGDELDPPSWKRGAVCLQFVSSIKNGLANHHALAQILAAELLEGAAKAGQRGLEVDYAESGARSRVLAGKPAAGELQGIVFSKFHLRVRRRLCWLCRPCMQATLFRGWLCTGGAGAACQPETLARDALRTSPSKKKTTRPFLPLLC